MKIGTNELDTEVKWRMVKDFFKCLPFQNGGRFVVLSHTFGQTP